MTVRNRDRALGARGGSDLGAAAFVTLMAAPGADCFFDAGYGYAIDGANKVSLLASRIGSYTLEQATAGSQPTWGAISPTGRYGITFSSTGTTNLADPLTTLGGLYDGSQAYSALYVIKYATLNGRCPWAFVVAGSSSHRQEHRSTATTGAQRVTRGGVGGTTNADGAGAVFSTSIACVVDIYSGSAYSGWIDGASATSAVANTRVTTLDQLMIGCTRSGGANASQFGGVFHALILSRTQWSTQQRQDLEAAAKIYWGSP